jgi:hypothetical protein
VATVLTEGPRRAAHLVSEANGSLSREQVTIASGADLDPGTVLGKITTGGKYVILAPAAVDGSQNAAGILYAKAAAASADVIQTVNVRQCEVNGTLLTWPAGITGPQKVTALAALVALGIIVR